MVQARTDTRLSKKLYETRLPAIREELVKLQIRLKETPSKVLLIFAGEEGGGRAEVINSLTSWLDPRGVETFAFRPPSDEERERPLMWRFWRCLPAQGRLGIFAGSWYTELLRAQATAAPKTLATTQQLEHIRNFEKLLSSSGTLIIKVWLHLSKSDQRKRFAELEANPDTAWRVTDDARLQHAQHERLSRAATRLRVATDRPGASWDLINAADPRERNLAVAALITRKLQDHLKSFEAPQPKAPPRPAAPTSLQPAGLARLLALPLDQSLSGEEYETKREKWLGRLNRATRAAQAANRSIVFVFEGWDAAGKGGAIRRLTSAIDAQDYRVIPVAKPTDEENAHHYLWRFWRHLPRSGLTTIYDRSWYGRVLVERLEGFCTEAEWQRAYEEINDFEAQLVEHGTIVIKFWMHVSREEQLRRFREREKTAYKQHKINAEDWRNRRKWNAYEIAVGDMLALTEKPIAPWHLIPSNNKRYARLQILKTAVNAIEAALGLKA